MYQDLSTYAQGAYREYALYVLLDRALPRYTDGLKPVQRRLLYTMHELGLGVDAKPKKSVRVVGDTLGKYHPHSDVACYEALIGLAQPFASRYALITGQGNYGSLDDPKSFAAMRYTEAKLSRYANLLLSELTKNSVVWQKNFDGTTLEPTELPAQLPVLLLNGCSGIAVGLTSEIPPHNLTELVDALIYYIDHPKANERDLIPYLKGPDFPTGGILYATETDLLTWYQTGRGVFTLTAKMQREQTSLVITEIPYGSSGSKVMEQLHELIEQKALPPQTELIDESDEDSPLRIVLRFKTQMQAQEAQDVIIEKTDLKIQYRSYFHAIDATGRPVCYSLTKFFNEWLDSRLNCLKAQYAARKEEILERRGVLRVYRIACQSLPTIFHALSHEDDPWAALQSYLQLSDDDVKLMSQIKLKELTKISAEALDAEEQELLQEETLLTRYLTHRHEILSALKKQLKEIKKTYGDQRRTQLISETLEKKSLKNSLKHQSNTKDTRECRVILTELGWLKCLIQKSQDKQDDLSTQIRPGDQIIQVLNGLTMDSEVLCWDQRGRCYGLSVSQISTSKFGEHVSAYLNIPSGHQLLISLLKKGCALILTRQGYGFVINLEEIATQSRGKQIVTLGDDDAVIAIQFITGDYILFQQGSKFGLMSIEQIPQRQSGKGLLLFKQQSDEPIMIRNFKSDEEKLAFVTDNGRKTLVSTEEATIKRGNLLKNSKKNTSVVVIT